MTEFVKLSYRMWEIKKNGDGRIVWLDKDKWKCGCRGFHRKGSCGHIRSLWGHLEREASHAGKA